MKFPFKIILVALGGFLFGYQTAIISGAQIFLTKYFDLSVFEESFIVSAIIIGALIGACAAGTLADHLGRKKALFLTAALFIVGSCLSAAAVRFDTLVAGRLIAGMGVGIASLASPLYISESSPAQKRGMFVSFNQLMIATGILIAYCVNFAFSFSEGWRWMLILGAVPAVALAIGLFFVPESPTWLANPIKGAITPSLQKNWGELLNPRLRFVLVVGIVLSMLQQLTGINAVIYYGPKIFEMAGFKIHSYAILATIGIGIINVCATMFSLKLVDTWGRKKLLRFSLSGMVISLLLLAWAFFANLGAIGPIAIISQMTYVAFFAFGLGPVPWVIISEIYPHNIRGRAMSICIFVNWACNYLIAFGFLFLARKITIGGTFLLYAFFSFVGLWFVQQYLFETKNKSLNTLEESLER